MRFLGLIALLLTVAGCDQRSVTELRVITVNGVGVVATAPDVALVRMGVETREETSQAAMNANSELTQSVINALVELGVAEQDIRTESLQLNPRYESVPGPNRSRQQQLVGYRASNIISVRLRDLSEAGAAIDVASNAGVNRIDSIGFEVSDPSAATDKARELAWADAQLQAEQLAELAGAELGAVQSVNVFNSGPRVAQQMDEIALRSSVPVAGGQQNISVQIQVVWSLVAKSANQS